MNKNDLMNSLVRLHHLSNRTEDDSIIVSLSALILFHINATPKKRLYLSAISADSDIQHWCQHLGCTSDKFINTLESLTQSGYLVKKEKMKRLSKYYEMPVVIYKLNCDI